MFRCRCVTDLMDHIIYIGNKIWGNTNRKDTWMWHHDNLTLYWSKAAQDYLKKMPSPIEGWPDRTWADRQLRLGGRWAEEMKAKANGKKKQIIQATQLPGNGPEIMSLDCHLFAHLKEAAGRNVIATFFLDEGAAGKYSMSNVDETFEAIERTIQAGSVAPQLIEENFMRIFVDRPDGTKSTLQRIVDADGCYISDSANRDRHGRRLALFVAEKKERQINVSEEANAQLMAYLRRVLEEGGDALNEAPATVYKFRDEVEGVMAAMEENEEDDEDDEENEAEDE
jgi:hypothetical protein